MFEGHDTAFLLPELSEVLGTDNSTAVNRACSVFKLVINFKCQFIYTLILVFVFACWFDKHLLLLLSLLIIAISDIQRAYPR